MKRVTLILLLFSLATGSLNAQALSGNVLDTHPMHWARYYARNIFDRNLVYCPIWNIGLVTDSNLSPGQGLEWPGSEGLRYGSYFVFYIGTKVTDMSQFEGKVVPEQWDGTEIKIVSDAYMPHTSVHSVAQTSTDKTHQQVWAPIPGYFNDGVYGFIEGINEDTDGDGELSPAEDVNLNGSLDLALDPPPVIIKSLAISTDKRTWPKWWPGGSYIGDERPDHMEEVRQPRTVLPGLRVGRWNGEYKAAPIADQETLYRMDDHENDAWNDYREGMYWPLKNSDGTPDTRDWKDGGVAGSGIEVEGRTYAWFHPLAEDLLVSVYRVRNYSDYILNRVVTGMWADANIVQGDYNAASFIKAQYDYEGGGGRLDFDILYQWHQFPEQLSTYKKVGTFAFAFLESPGIAYNQKDDDYDDLIDESMEDGIDNDNDWVPFADVGLDKLGPGDEGYKGPDADGTEGNGRWDTEDTNLNGALDKGEDQNQNNKLDMEPIRDDRGTDGIGPDENGWLGPDPNGTEANGIMDLGEPNFDLTDIDEADQAGLKHIYVYESRKDLKDDRGFWELYLEREAEDVVESDEDIVFTFGARAVKLDTMEWARFTIALVMGEDQDDAIRNKATMQRIYNANYQFLTPPLQPTVVSNVGDKSVQLYWDTDAEMSKDPFFGEDFNGYRVYKSTNPQFLDIKKVSDAFGNVLLFKPLAIFDKQDGLKGPHPIPFPNLGAHYDMGKDVGLKHSYLDTLVDNGRTYYYAVTSIDAGNDWDFYERGLVSEDYPMEAMPSESPFSITVNPLGEVVYRDRNTAVCIPVEPAAGYVDPFVDSLKISHVSGWTRGGRWNIDIFNKLHAKLGHEYELTFTDDHWLDNLTPQYEWGSTTGIRCMNLTTGDTLFNYKYDNNYEFVQNAFREIERGVFEGLHFDFGWRMAYSGGNDNDRGIRVIKENEYGRETPEWKRWITNTKSNLRCERIEVVSPGEYLPFDFEIRVEDHVGVDTSVSPSFLIPSYPLNFTTWNVTDPNNPHQMKVQIRYDKYKSGDIPEEMYGQIWDSTRVLITFPNHEGIDKTSYTLRFHKNSFDSLAPVIPPSPGDIYLFRTERNPTRHDTLRFVIEGGEWNREDAKEEIRNIYVVPDPYVVGNDFESIYELAGYSQRRVDFVNLPPKATISVFTASGKLVTKIDHESSVDFGRCSWDLTSEDGPEIAFGMYFFVVETEGLGTFRGKFAVIK
ncbi:hypothetical protein EH223_10240 [candidate division KSB1 bacterium]|nr:hypothetical protein [candidate division KSB1 bacterium]RQW03323.1 MAG: hypothetical protein EH223_10240 [candidate division KSB1 bacterium]